MDLKELMKQTKKKEFRSEVLSSKRTVFGSPYTVGDSVRMSALFGLDDEAFYFAELVGLLADKYDLSEIEKRSLTVVEIMWLLRDLRINSSGPKVAADCTCQHCRHVNRDREIDYTKIRVDNGDNFEYEIQTGEYTLGMRVCDAVTFYRIFGGLKLTGPELIEAVRTKSLELFKASLRTIATNGQMIDAALQPKEDLDEWVAKFLPEDALEKFDAWADKLPSLRIDQVLKCDKCGKEFRVEPLDFFFSAL